MLASGCSASGSFANIKGRDSRLVACSRVLIAEKTGLGDGRGRLLECGRADLADIYYGWLHVNYFEFLN